MKNTVEKVIKRSIKICKNWKILTRNKNFTAGQKMGANALLFFHYWYTQFLTALLDKFFFNLHCFKPKTKTYKQPLDISTISIKF